MTISGLDAELVPGQTYTGTLTITNQSTKGGSPVSYTFYIRVVMQTSQGVFVDNSLSLETITTGANGTGIWSFDFKVPATGYTGIGTATAYLLSSSLSVLSTAMRNFTIKTIVPPTGMLRMNMKSYGNHNPTYDARILAIKPEYVIDNPPHGLYGEMDEEKYHENYTYPYLLQNISAYHAAGIKIIGYISSGYEGKGGDDHYASKWYSLEMNKKIIINMATLDRIDGVFIDECSDFPNSASKSYLQQLSDLVHSYGLIVWTNTGVDNFDPWFFTSSVSDLAQSSEAWVGQSLTPVQQQWGSRIGVTGFKKSYTAQKAFELTISAWNKGISYCYINNTEYTSIAPWFEEYAQMLRNYSG